MSESQPEVDTTDANQFETIPLDEPPSCRICSSNTTEEQLIRVCKCEGVLQWVHFSCLSSHIKITKKDQCAFCKTKFIGIKIEYISQGFITFVKSKEDILPAIICTSFGFSFLYYILYLAVIDYILSEGLVNTVMRLFLLVPTILYGFLFTGVLIGLFVNLGENYTKWRERNHRIEVQLLAKNPEPETTVPKTEDPEPETNVEPKSEEKSNEVAIDIEANQSTDKESEQTLKVNTTEDNQNKAEIRQKGQ